MKRLFIIILSIVSCTNQVEINEDFLPGLKNIKNENKISNFSYSSSLISYSKDGDSLPELMELSKKIKPGNIENSNLFFSVDHKINLPQQGYVIDIQKNTIEIKAKDYEGLFYSFVTLSQLLYISKSQKRIFQ